MGKSALSKDSRSDLRQHIRMKPQTNSLAHINQGALKKWMTWLIPQRTQGPLCKVRRQRETNTCERITEGFLLAVLPQYVITDGC